MNKMTKRLLAVGLALPLYAVACDDAGETVWANLQLTAAKQVPVEWPLLPGHLKGNILCIDKKDLAPRFLQADLPVYIHPKTDLTFTLDNVAQSIKAEWALDIYGIAGLPTLAKDGKTYLSSCVIQQLSFQVVEKSSNKGGQFSLNAQVQMPEVKECQGIETVKQWKAVMPEQWSLHASFILLDGKQKITTMPNQESPTPKDEPSKLEQFLNLPPADEDAKKRMKKR